MAQKDFEASPPATGGARDLAADLVTNAAIAVRTIEKGLEFAQAEAAANAALAHRHPDVRSAAISALATLGVLSCDDLEVAVGDEAPVVRRRAVEATADLVQHGSTDSSQAERWARLLITSLGDESVVAEVAAFGLGEFGPAPPHLSPPVLTDAAAALEAMAAGHKDALCRESAVAALGALHSGRSTVLAAMNDKATVRRRAVLALSPFDGQDVDAAIKAALNDRDWQVRQAAEDQVAARNGES
ncbi:MAG: hypothetical protein HKN03_11160 [Acidimicrobiales bacterium]|nr:hypothetical protein [Acidimicrobiales bacterium]